MNRLTAAVGSALFFAAAPGVVAGLVPWWLTRWQVRGSLAHWAPVRMAGLILLIAGAIVLVQAFARFVAEGRGTPAAGPGSAAEPERAAGVPEEAPPPAVPPNRPGYTELHSFAWCGRLTGDVTSICQPEGRSGMMGGLEPEGESVSVDTSVPHIAR